jgi:ethanolamine transporter EutH
MFGMFDAMSPKGMVFKAAFKVGAASALGNHLAYLGAVQLRTMVPLCGAALSFLICLFVGDFF